MSDAIRPFRIDVPDAVLDDLHDRLRRTRWAEPETVADWSQGIPFSYVRDLCGYWADTYSWRTSEERMNRFPQFHSELDGLDVHFLHVTSPHPGALPLVVTHGWPGSVVEFAKVIEPLVDPPAHGGEATDAFHVVAPSLPGYGFSAKPSQPGWSVERTARAWAELMARLGYDRYVAQGGDWGAQVTTAIGMADHDHVAGIHLNMPIAFPPTTENLTERERSALESVNHYQRWDSGYSKQQSTRPQTLGYGLVDSPAGLCAWIVEKLWSWTDCDGDPANVLSRDEMLDNVMLYWVPGTGASSARLYWESFTRPVLGPVEVPTACSIFPKEIFRPTRAWAEPQFPNLVYWNELERGGHFAAWEQPEAFVNELRAAFRPLR